MIKLINIKNRKIQSFSKFISFCLVSLSILQVAKSTILETNNFEFIDINPWAFTDLYINYEGGFVRRGFIGNLIYIFDDDGILFDTLYIVVFLNFCIFVGLTIFNLRLSNLSGLQKMLFHLSIFSAFNMTLFGHYYARKEIFILNLFLVLTLLIKRNSNILFIFLSNIFGILAILIHEGIGFFIFFPFVSYLLSKKEIDKKYINLFRLIVVSIFGISSLYKGNKNVSDSIINSLSNQDLYLFNGLDPNAITALNWGASEVLRSLYVLVFSGSIILWGVFVFLVIYTISTITSVNINTTFFYIKNLMLRNIEFVLIPILFFLGWDWGRWILTIFYFLFFIFIIENKETNINFYQIKIILPFIVISLLTSMPPCCLEMGSTKVSSNIYRILKSIELTLSGFF